MAKRKLERFAENKTFPHFFQPTWNDLMAGFPLQNNWNEKFFKNPNPIIVELGCGKGEYTVGLAGKYPHQNYIGMDKKGARLWRGAKTSFENKLPNVAFLRSFGEHLPLLFGEHEISEIWITFPEPQPRSPKTKKRFTSPEYIERYRKILKPDGIVHLKTDDDFFWNYSLESVRNGGHQLLFATEDLYADPALPEVADVVMVQTFYEQMWLEQGKKIKYLRFIPRQTE